MLEVITCMLAGAMIGGAVGGGVVDILWRRRIREDRDHDR